jgi:O-antigen/teichoic acid export membrane protein
MTRVGRSAITRTVRAIGYLRLRPFDTSTTDGRSAERYRRAAWATLAGVSARGIGLLITLITIPLAVGYLGAEQYGVWATISALSTMLLFADFGLGNGLLSAVARAHGTDDRAVGRRAVSSAFVMLIVIGGVLVVAFALAYPITPWAEIANVSTPEAAAEVGPAILAFFICFVVSLPLGLVQRVQYGYQEGFEVGVWTAIGSVISLIALIAAIRANATLPWLVLSLAGGPAIGLALNTVVVFFRRHPDLRPRLRLATRRAAGELVRVGLLFFVLQLAVAIAFQSNVVVAAQLIGPAAAAEYSVVLRLFFIVPNILWMALLPLWPAYGEATGRGDVRWMRRTVVRSTVAAVGITALTSALLVAFGGDVLRLWVGPIFDPSFALLLGMAVWAVVSTAGTSIAMLLNGASVMAFQAAVAVVMAVASIAASIILGSIFGLAGVIWGTLLAYIVCNAIPILWYLPRLFHQLEMAHRMDDHTTGQDA